ncbi:MAG: EAL domain-containing protein [Hormoscilla sp. GM7CHS1pb]|nr:EAL domain-containing protein [Hormoscilla sp. GM7CHS1pb]
MKPAKILVVDDQLELERLIKQRFRKNLKAKEFEFFFVYNGVEALRKLETEPQIDMILTDINMPEMDGLTLLEKVLKIYPNIKTVVMSAYGEIQNIRTAMNFGAFDFLIKPIDFEDLEITIKKTLKLVEQMKAQQQQLQQAMAQLQYQAAYDRLTNLPNRYQMLEEIRQCLEDSQQGCLFAVLFLELDHYRRFKYSFGHEQADRLLVEVASRLKTCVGPKDRIAHVGENEFAIFLKDIQEQQAVQKASDIHMALELPFNFNGTVMSSTTSMGIVFSNIGYHQPEEFLRAADTAMHYGKMPSFASTVLFDLSMQTKAIERLHLEADLQRAIKLQQLHLNYQPIVSLKTDEIVGFEALVRWDDPTRGLVSPTEFIPLAEETGLIIPLGEWVLSEACRQLSIWRDRLPDHFRVSVNLSGMQLWHPLLLQFLDDLLLTLSLSGSCLKLEITESILMQNSSAAIALLEQFKQRQIQLSMDDFGTGYSSFSYLQRLPIDTLKLDRSFVDNIEGHGKDFDIAKAIITLAHSLGLDVIAEGIETPQQREILRSLDCEYGQGYLFSRPLDGQEVIEFMATINPQYNDGRCTFWG